jgi:hypothetical protein
MAKTFTLQRSVFMADAGAGLAFGHRFEKGTEVTVEESGKDSYWNAYAMHEGRKYLVHLNPLELAQAFEHVSRETAAK